MGVASGTMMPSHASLGTTTAAASYTVALLALGYCSFGFWTTLVFASGFLGGFILWLFAPAPKQASFDSVKRAYWTTFALFLVHRVEENVFRFQEALSAITRVPVPELASIPLIALVLASVGSWLVAPALISRGYRFSYYLGWTFFAAMGLTELAHFVFPFLVPGPYRYFPGMITVIALAPAAWFGMSRLAQTSTVQHTKSEDLIAR